MSVDATSQRTIAAVFDLRQPASRETLRKVVGIENVPQFEAMNHPFVVLVIAAPHGNPSRLSFENEERFLDFYLATLRTNATLEPQQRVQFVLRDLAPMFEDALRKATQDLVRESAGA
ncbi:MAG TPA: hypothetical protein VGM97_12170 [Steroidobacteraceae bacterium]|jgi:hypothetical protein